MAPSDVKIPCIWSYLHIAAFMTNQVCVINWIKWLQRQLYAFFMSWLFNLWSMAVYTWHNSSAFILHANLWQQPSCSSFSSLCRMISICFAFPARHLRSVWDPWSIVALSSMWGLWFWSCGGSLGQRNSPTTQIWFLDVFVICILSQRCLCFVLKQQLRIIVSLVCPVQLLPVSRSLLCWLTFVMTYCM